jgi:hypothetical protein
VVVEVVLLVAEGMQLLNKAVMVDLEEALIL